MCIASDSKHYFPLYLYILFFLSLEFINKYFISHISTISITQILFPPPSPKSIHSVKFKRNPNSKKQSTPVGDGQYIEVERHKWLSRPVIPTGVLPPSQRVCDLINDSTRRWYRGRERYTLCLHLQPDRKFWHFLYNHPLVETSQSGKKTRQEFSL